MQWTIFAARPNSATRRRRLFSATFTILETLFRRTRSRADWYRKAARQDDRLADWLLGRLYYSGSGVPRDLSAAEPWLQKSANQGDPFGQYLLGLIRLERNDYPKAADWFRKAAMQGLPQAQQH